MKFQDFSQKIKNHIRNGDLESAIQDMSYLFKNSKKLNEVILYSARLNDLMHQVRMGIIPREDADVGKNQITKALLDLLEEVKKNVSNNTELTKEVEAVEFENRPIQITQSHRGYGDNVGGDKFESHHHVKGHEPEKKNAFFYYMEVGFMFLFPTGIALGIGAAIGQVPGALIGGLIGAVIGLVNAGSVKRTKGIL